MKRTLMTILALAAIGLWQLNDRHMSTERLSFSGTEASNDFLRETNLPANPFVNQDIDRAISPSLERAPAQGQTGSADGHHLAKKSAPISALQISKLLADLEDLSKPSFTSDSSPEKLKVRHELIVAMENDSAAVELVVQALHKSIISGNVSSSEQIGDLLAHVKDATILQHAQNWFRNGKDLRERQIALELMKSQVIENTELREAALESILWEVDDKLWLDSVDHMVDLDPMQEATSVIEDRIRVLMASDDPELRSQATRQFAPLAHRDDQLHSVAMMLQDPDPTVRLSAAHAMQFMRKRSAATKAALLNVLSSSQESEELREAALHALGSHQVSEDRIAQYSSYIDFDGG